MFDIPESYKKLNLNSTGIENIEKTDIHKSNFISHPTWRIVQPNLILDPGVKTIAGQFYRVTEGEGGEKEYTTADTLEGVLIASVFFRIKRNDKKETECYSDDGKRPIPKYAGRFSDACATCPYYRMKKEDLAGQAPCKQNYKFVMSKDGTDNDLELLILSGGNYREVTALLAMVDTGNLVPGLKNIKSLFAYRFKITTELQTGGAYRYYNAKFEVTGLNELAKVTKLDGMISQNNGLFLGSGSESPVEPDPETAPPKQPMFPGQKVSDDGIPF